MPDNVNWIAIEKLEGEMEVQAKIRYNDPGASAVIRPSEKGTVELRFIEPQRAVTPGQSVVFYHGDVVAGGGVIRSFIKNERN